MRTYSLSHPAPAALFRPPLRRRRAVSPIIGTILLVSLTVVLISLVYVLVVVPVSPPPPYIGVSVTYSPHQTYYGDANLCPPTTGACPSLPAVTFTLTQVVSPAPSYSLVDLLFHCNGTAYLDTGLTAALFDPSVPPPTPVAPTVGNCGTFSPGLPPPVFNELLYYQPLHPGAGRLAPGDQIVVYLHAALPPSTSYAGAPPWCLTVPGACTLELLYTGSAGAVLLNLALQVPSGVG